MQNSKSIHLIFYSYCEHIWCIWESFFIFVFCREKRKRKNQFIFHFLELKELKANCKLFFAEKIFRILKSQSGLFFKLYIFQLIAYFCSIYNAKYFNNFYVSSAILINLKIENINMNIEIDCNIFVECFSWNILYFYFYIYFILVYLCRLFSCFFHFL